MLPNIFQWLFTNIFLALFPFFIYFLLSAVYGLRVGWLNLIKEGELFLFSTTLSASSITQMVMPSTKTDILSKEGAVYTFIALIIMLAVSSLILGISAFIKLQGNITIPTSGRRFAISAISCALATTILSYVAFLQGGSN